MKHPPHLHHQQGFTLLEIMVVLVIMGIMVSFATLGLGSSPEKPLGEEAQRLQARIQLAAENAVLEGRDLGIGVYKSGYLFFELQDDEKWASLAGDPQLRETKLPEEMEAQLSLEGSEIVMPGKPPEKPQVFILSSGESTPFSLEFSFDDPDIEPAVISFDQLGRPLDEASAKAL
ncbi:MAG: type II secretion system minor pseudopilin GspH [bacterium]